jgi:hypothetical protein
MLKCEVRFRLKSVILVSLAVTAVTFIEQGCARPDSFRRTEATSTSSPSDQRLPFHEESEHVSDNSAHPALPLDPKPSIAPPFQIHPLSRVLPAGTLITVRLDTDLLLTRAHPGDTFAASIAGPVTLEGKKLISRGVKVTGHVEATQPAVPGPGRTADPSLARLTLDAIVLDRNSFALQTSSLFAKGTRAKAYLQNQSLAGGESSPITSEYQLLKGHRLTFRLTAPLTLSESTSVSDRRSSDSSN